MSADDPYEGVSGGGLKLKGGASKIKKKKSKKSNNNKAKEIVEQASEEAGTSRQPEEEVAEPEIKKTAAEIAFQKSQERRATERIMKKASKTHKQRVEELNEYLGSLTEHYDVQKVSWTK